MELWAAVADLVRRGLLAPAATSAGGGKAAPAAAGDEQQRLQAAAECQSALRALGLTASAEHMAVLAGAQGSGSKAASSSKASSSRHGTAPNGSKGISATASSSSKHPPDGGGEQGLGLSDARFQLRHCGELLPHAVPPQRDPRVESFNPDEWQRRVSQKCWFASVASPVVMVESR